MDQLQEYYGALGEGEQNMANPEVGRDCAAFFAGLLNIKLIICFKIEVFCTI